MGGEREKEGEREREERGLTHTVYNGVFSGHGLSRELLGGSGPRP